MDEGVAARERAVEGYAQTDRCDEAARLAVWVSHQHSIAGRASAARGWLARAERAVDRAGLCAGQGWVAAERARHAATVEESAEHARRALEIARETDADDLEVFAVSVLGRAEVSAGRIDEGMRLLEEAMAAASAGRVRNVHTLAEAYCNLIAACTSAGDWERATEWCELVDEFAREHETAPLYGSCRTIHADVLLATGRWDDAERALQSALDVHARYVTQLAAPTVAAMAELRVRQNRLSEAELLLVGREEHPESSGRSPTCASPRAVPRGGGAARTGAPGGRRGRPQDRAAPGRARRRAHRRGSDRRGRGRLAQADELADESGIPVVTARAGLAAARAHVAAERPDAAAEAARGALADFGSMRCRTRRHRPGSSSRGRSRRRARRSPSRRRAPPSRASASSARRGRDEAAALLRSLGAPTGGLPRGVGELTAREHEVLGLLGLGMSNAQIAETLVISEKTAGHHVSRILAKLGVRNRAEAAAVAARSESAATRDRERVREFSRCARGHAGARLPGRRTEGDDMSTQLDDTELKARHRAMWSSGDYPLMVKTFLLPVGERLVEACGIGPGIRACSTSRPEPATPRCRPRGAAPSSRPAT